MITFDEALSKILEKIEPLPAEPVPTGKLLGRVLSTPVIAGIDSPPFDNSAVDGYGVKVADLQNASAERPVKLRLQGVVRAGDAGNAKISGGQALKILTGACVPPSVEAVVMKEQCVEENGHVSVAAGAELGENIRRRGGEFLRGKEVLPANVVASPPVVGLIASLGFRQFPAFRVPSAAVVTTGDELTKLGRRLDPGRIFDSNSYAIEAAMRAAGLTEIVKSHAAEDEQGTIAAFRRALAYADIIVSTGGVSVGDFDYVKSALEKLNVETNVWRIAIKPGKPVYFGVHTVEKAGLLPGSKPTKRHRYIFGLPGNPVSAMVTFRLFVVPALAKMMGADKVVRELHLKAELTKTLKKRAGRAEFVRAIVHQDGGKLMAEPTSGQDSHMLSGLAKANALITFPLEAEVIEAGSQVDVQFLDWSL